MKVKIQQFLFDKPHSWSVVGQNIGRALLKLGHDVDFISTDGFKDEFCPDDLKPFVKMMPKPEEKWPYDNDYTCQFSYTAPINWPDYLQHGKKNRFGMWAFEYNGKNILNGFAKYHHACTKVLPVSNFTKTVFISMGIPEDKMVVVPHGINLEDFQTKIKTPIHTNKSKKILLNIAQIHRRKAIPLALEAFGKAFTKEDDVCLIAKVLIQNKGDHQFDVDFHSIYKTFERKFPKHADVEFVTKYIPNVAELYNACDINFSATHAECFHLPSLEALAGGLINVVPRYGGILDFCNDDNSLLIEGDIKRCPREHLYWKNSSFAVHFVINTDDAAEKLKHAVYSYDKLIEKFGPNMKKTSEIFTWENSVKQILNLCI